MQENIQDRTQALLDRLNEADRTISGFACVIVQGLGEFHSVWDITNQVLDRYYGAKAA